MDEREQMRQIAAGEKPSCPYVPPLYAETSGEIRDRRVEFVNGGECAIAIIPGEDIVPGAPKWNQCINPKSETWIPFIVLVLAMEYKRLGAFYINAPRGMTGDFTYKRTVEAIAKVKLGRDDDRDRKIITANTEPSHYIHKEQQMDIRAAIQKLQKTTKKPEKNKENKKKKKQEEEEDAPPSFESALEEDSFILDTFSEGKRGEKEEEEEEEEKLDANAAVPIIADGPEVQPKVTFTVALVKNDKDAVVGYLVRFLIHDVGWNPGKMLGFIYKYQELRKTFKDKPGFKDEWPQYASWAYSGYFPLFALTRQDWFDCANTCRGFQADFHDTMEQLANRERPDMSDSPTNPLRMCTLNRALYRLRQAGGIVGTDQDYREEDKVAVWPSFHDVFAYHPEQVLYDHDELVGLWNQYLPKANPKELSPELTAYLRHTINPTIARVNQLSPQGSHFIRTSNLVVHFSQEADQVQADVERKIAREGEQAAEEIVKRANWEQMQKFKLFCLPPKHLIDSLNISPALKKMNNWMLDMIAKDQSVSVEFELYDPDMTLFGNYVARHILLIEKCGLQVQPIVCFKMRALWSVYQRRLNQLLWNMKAHGPGGTGKSTATIKYGVDYFIPDTLTALSRQTAASDQTHMDVHDEIRGWDEGQEEKNVELKKSQMTTGESILRTTEFINVNGNRRRVGQIIRQSTNFTEVVCQNGYPKEDEALASRWHYQLVLEPSIPMTRVMTIRPEKRITPEMGKTAVQTTQFLVCFIEKAMAIYAIPCRNPYMHLFLDISDRMVETLDAWGVLSANATGGRRVAIMCHMARVLTIEKAALLTWHVKGAPHFGKVFHPDQIKDCTPHLWCDAEITLLTWTLHSNDWIRSEFGNVLKAMCEVALGRPWEASMTPYEYFASDVENRVKFKMDRNMESGTDQKHMRKWIDLNYLEIPQSLRVAASEIASHTRPRMLASDVEALLIKLSDTNFTPRTGEGRRNGYERRLYFEEIRNAHRLVPTPKIRLDTHKLNDAVEAIVRDNWQVAYGSIAARLKDQHFANCSQMVQDDVIRNLQQNQKQMLILYLWPDEPLPSVNELAAIAGRLSALRPNHDELRELGEAVHVPNRAAEPDLDSRHYVGQISGANQQILYWALKQGWILRPGEHIHHYLKKPIVMNAPFPHYGCEDDIPSLHNSGGNQDHEIPIVDLTQKNRRVCFSPMAIALFDPKVIIDAFVYATLCSTTSPGKRILGWMHREDPTKLEILNFTPDYIAQTVDYFVADAMPGAVSRTEGIPFKRVGFLDESEYHMMLGSDLANQYKRGGKTPESNIEVIRNLDWYAAEAHRKACHGSWPIHVRDRDIYQGPVGEDNYPEDAIRQKQRQRATNWGPNDITPNSRHISQIALGSEPFKRNPKRDRPELHESIDDAGRKVSRN